MQSFVKQVLIHSHVCVCSSAEARQLELEGQSQAVRRQKTSITLPGSGQTAWHMPSGYMRPYRKNCSLFTVCMIPHPSFLSGVDPRPCQ